MDTKRSPFEENVRSSACYWYTVFQNYFWNEKWTRNE